ncbi:MAG: small multi-drug export protein [Patescibacteria group bacterium]|jgi:uncharacterized membrane protein
MEISWIYNIHPLVATFLLSILPVFELRAAIPMVMANFDTPLWQIFVVAVLSSIIPGILIVYFLGPISNWLRRWKIFDRFFDALFARTRAKYDKKYAVLSKVALMLFVAIPLPGTGVWTGSLIAWLFNFDKQQSLIYIGLGSFLAGVLVMMISLGAFKIFEIIL